MTKVGALDGLAELHLIADQYDIRGAGRHAGEVGDGNLPGLINEKIISLPSAVAFENAQAVPPTSCGEPSSANTSRALLAQLTDG